MFKYRAILSLYNMQGRTVNGKLLQRGLCEAAAALRTRGVRLQTPAAPKSKSEAVQKQDCFRASCVIWEILLGDRNLRRPSLMKATSQLSVFNEAERAFGPICMICLRRSSSQSDRLCLSSFGYARVTRSQEDVVNSLRIVLNLLPPWHCR